MHAVKVPHRVDEEAFRQLVMTHGDGLLRMCYLYLGDRMLAEDAVQDTFVKAYRSIESFHGESNEKTWLTRIAINTCKNYRRAPWHRLIDRSVVPEALAETGKCDDFNDGEVIRAVMKLPAIYKEVILLYYYQELSADEIAEALRISRQAVYARLKRAKRKLRPGLEGWYFDE